MSDKQDKNQSSTKSTHELLKSLDNYIEYAHATKRFADVGFYEDLKDKLIEMDNEIAHHENCKETLRHLKDLEDNMDSET